MKHQIVLIFVLVWLLIGGMLLYIFAPRSLFTLFTYKKIKVIPTKAPTLVVSHNFPSTNPNVLSTGNTSFDDFLYSEKTQKCVFKENTGITETVYMNQDNIRGDFTGGNLSKKTIHLLTDGELAYIWTDGSTNGSSTPESQTANVNTIMQTAGVSSFDMKAKKAYLCNHWKADATVFAAPGDINFVATPGK